MKMIVPAPPLLRPLAMFLTSVERTVDVKCLNRASGSFACERLSMREKVCLIETGNGSSVMAPA